MVLKCVLFSILLCASSCTFAQDVIPVPQESAPAPASPGLSGEEDQSPRCESGYTIVSCSAENAKFARAFDFTMLLGVPILFGLIFLFGNFFLGRRSWWMVKPWVRLGVCFAFGFLVAGLLLLVAPFVPQASPVRMEIGPIRFVVDGNFVSACHPCRDGVTNPGVFFGVLRWLTPPHGLLPENSSVLLGLPFIFLIFWFAISLLVFFVLRSRSGIRAGL